MLLINESRTLYLLRVIWNDAWQQKTMYTFDTIFDSVCLYSFLLHEISYFKINVASFLNCTTQYVVICNSETLCCTQYLWHGIADKQ